MTYFNKLILVSFRPRDFFQFFLFHPLEWTYAQAALPIVSRSGKK